MRFQVAGMPWRWKLANFCFVLAPKVYIWLLLADAGCFSQKLSFGRLDVSILAPLATNFALGELWVATGAAKGTSSGPESDLY